MSDDQSRKYFSDSNSIEGFEELLLANESLARHGKFYSDVFDTVQDLLFVLRTTEQGFVILKANPAAGKLIGCSADDIVGDNLNQYFRFSGHFGDNQLKLLNENKNSGVDAEVKAGKQWIPVLASWSFLNDGVEGLKVLALSDVTELRKAHLDLVRAKEEALAASKAKSDFLANMSHEIRTPLNAILGVTDILMDTALSDEQKEYILLFKKSGESLLGLINDILDISKIEARKMEVHEEVVHFRELVAGVDSLLRVKAQEKNILLKFHVAPEIAAYQLTDGQKFRQVLFNIVGNAVKFTERGEVFVRICLHPDDTNLLHIVVRDSGVGIPLDKQGQLFEQFVQADSSITRSYGGTGLGLTISRSFVELMNGQIGFESLPNEGTVFYFTWPYRASLPPQDIVKEVTDEQLMAKIQRPVRVLLVDDTASNRIIVRTYLKKLPVEVVEAENAENAIQIFSDSPNWDLILMDIQMPGMDGNSATRKIREIEVQRQLPPTVIIALTAQALREEKQASLEAGCNEHLPKPVSRRNLLSCLVRWTQSG